MQCGVSPAGRYSARKVAGQLPPNASTSPVPATKSSNSELPRSMLKSPHTTAGPATLSTTRARASSWARCSG
jgi:hypothetical protein